ncbi:hypothetical protein ACLQ97_15920, partial [Bordetella avium]
GFQQFADDFYVNREEMRLCTSFLKRASLGTGKYRKNEKFRVPALPKMTSEKRSGPPPSISHARVVRLPMER